MNKKLKNPIIIFTIIIATFTLAHFVLAQDLGTGYASNLGLGNADPRVMAVNIVRIALTFIGIIAVCVIIYAGWLWMTAAGSPEKIDKAKKTLIGAVIGLIIILSAWAIVTFIINKMGEVTGDTCEFGVDPPKACTGCEGAGTQDCLASNTWGPCNTDCSGAAPCCCSGLCLACPCPFTPPVFVINVFSPPDLAVDVIRNKVIRVTFSNNIDSDTVDGSFRLIKTAGTGVLADGANCAGDPLNCASDNCDLVGTGNCIGNEVASISLVISGNKISFNPFNDCPAPYEAWKCFDANATYEIQADDGATGILRQGDGEELTCGGPFPCSAVFDTGIIIDTQNPSNLSLGISGNLCVDTFNSLAASADDDSGIDFFDFSDSHVGWFHTDNAPVCAGVPPNVTCAGAAVWNPTAAAGYIANNPYTLTLEAMDYDSNMSIINNNITLRQAHCCNDVWDEAEGEEGVDCGGPCAACSGAACGISLFETCAGDPDPNCDDSRCASGFCSCGNHPDGPLPDDSCQEKGYDAVVGNTCCVCEDKPRIDWVTPMGGFCNDDINMPCQEDADCATTCNTDTPNGAVGNFVTIGGRNFGDVAGIVTFCGAGTCADGDEQTADLPNTVNAACSDTWTDSQIIIVVPTGAVEGPIEVEEATTGNNYSDQTGDAYGNFINDFVINTIARPGLCLANPDNGILDDPFNLQGINFAGGVQEVLFGDGLASSILANNIQNWTNISVDADVPNITDGKTSVFVKVDNVGSNFLDFIKTPEPYSGPYITSFEPTAGSEGQYVTIYGSGFGAAKGISAVYFGDEFGTEANYDFPDVCADSVWSDNQIIIKVPTVADGNYTVTIVIGGSDIINTDDLSPNQFTVDSTLPLAPSLCKIQPIMGPNNSLVSLWGEYFGAVADIVRFHLNQDQSGGAIIFWGTEGDADKIETTVHGGAASGPVKVVQSGLEGNGLNFEVGLCTKAGATQAEQDDACGTDICCPVGSIEEGRCHATTDDCYITVTSSVYEWDFSTAGPTAVGDPCYVDFATTPFCTPTSPNCAAPQFCDPATCTCQLPYAESCMGFGQGECADNLCPNSPGNCSPYGGGETVIVGDCDDAECASRFGAGYTYNIILNKCVDGTACDLSETVPDGLGNPIIAYCANYAGAGRWHMDTSASCPVGWSSIGGNQCIEDATVCDYCDSGLSCLDDSGSGICGIDQKICPAGSTCNAGQCEKLDSEVCECCCREPGTGLYDAEDCCVPLICEGDCGADRAVDTDQFGYCSGCALAGTTQAEHDASCNCFHTSGKFCDTSDVDYPEGVCRDCAQLSTTGECALHPATCCADNKQGDVCRGGDGTLVAGGYCAYYDCQLPPDEDLCATTSPVMNAAYSDIFSCESGCGAELPPLPGLSCYDSDTGFCEIVCGTGYDCLGNSGCFDNDPADPRGSCAGGDMTCLCCCDPDPIFDKCSGINSVLTCTPNTDPCDGIERGLCCGCAQDNDCGDPNNIGCGFDGCCRSRPEVIENYPLDEDDVGYAPVVCRNTIIKATFDQEMDVGSFSGKVIVVGDYGAEQCPEGTEFLVKEDSRNKGKLARIFDRIKIFFKKIIKPVSYLARAYTSPVPADHNYCAIKGTVSGYNNAADQGVLIFSPSQLLDVNQEYYVIIKGDSDIADNISEGILNDWDIGMNGPNTEKFNARIYANGYIWAFEVDAMAEVCKLDYIAINPPSYIFQTANDLQIFQAEPKSSNEEIITAIAGIYNWSWSWSSDDISVANAVMQAAPNEMFGDVTSQNVKDGKTYIRAEAAITEDEINNTVGQSKEGEAQVYVFLCENPWPPVPPSGIWAPWIDTITNCSIPDAGCFDTKYDVYYCRDDGGVGTADDFSAILSDDTGVSGVIRGSSTAQDLLKEIYYLHEDIPDVPVSFSAVNNNIAIAGGSVNVNWTIVAGVDGYKIYYGTSAGNYDISIDIDNGAQNNYTVADLMNNTIYYFNLTSYDDTGAESEYISDDVEVFVEDEVAPVAPANLTAIAGDSQIELSWDANIDDTVGYKVYYGTSAGVYGDSQDVGDVIGAVVTGLTNGQVYYFAVTAYDDYDNESGYSVEIDSIPLACDAFTYDDVEYNVIRIGEQCWMAENLNIGAYVDSIDTGLTHSDVSDNGVIEKYCYDNDINNCDTYGGLYDWDEMMGYVITEGVQGICPDGWHIPTDGEQYELENYLKDVGETCDAGRSGVWDCDTAGTKLKSGGTSGFGGLLAGYRNNPGSFSNLTSYGIFWSSSVSGSGAWRRGLDSTESRVYRHANDQTNGFSVRCVKD